MAIFKTWSKCERELVHYEVKYCTCSEKRNVKLSHLQHLFQKACYFYKYVSWNSSLICLGVDHLHHQPCVLSKTSAPFFTIDIIAFEHWLSEYMNLKHCMCANIFSVKVHLNLPVGCYISTTFISHIRLTQMPLRKSFISGKHFLNV